jgi:hypothetical protein
MKTTLAILALLLGGCISTKRHDELRYADIEYYGERLSKIEERIKALEEKP